MIKVTKNKFASIVEEFDNPNELASIIKDSRVTILKSKVPRSPAELVSLYTVSYTHLTLPTIYPV